jgi:hypothetical protein
LSGVSPKMTDKDKQWFIQKIGFVEWNKLLKSPSR